MASLGEAKGLASLHLHQSAQFKRPQPIPLVDTHSPDLASHTPMLP